MFDTASKLDTDQSLGPDGLQSRVLNAIKTGIKVS